MKKRNHLLEAVADFFSKQPRGRVLDLGCGDGEYSRRLKDLGFEVTAGDIDEHRFRKHPENDGIDFRHVDITREMPFSDHTYDYVLLLEVVEHLRNPYSIFPELNRVIKKGGTLIISTPNILSMKSRLRYFFEGNYDFFREPPLDQTKNPKEVIFNLHILPYRYHELEYLLAATGFEAQGIFTSVYEGRWLGFLLPLLRLQAVQKEKRSAREKGIDYLRIHGKIFSNELLFGRHLIIQAKK